MNLTKNQTVTLDLHQDLKLRLEQNKSLRILAEKAVEDWRKDCREFKNWLKRNGCCKVPWTFRFARVGVLSVVLLLLVGCASKPAPIPPPAPKSALGQRVQEIRHEARSVTPAVVIPPKVRTNITLAWDNPPDDDWQEYRFSELWATRDLRTWYVKGTTRSNAITLPIQFDREFYKLRNGYTNVSPTYYTEWSGK